MELDNTTASPVGPISLILSILSCLISHLSFLDKRGFAVVVSFLLTSLLTVVLLKDANCPWEGLPGLPGLLAVDQVYVQQAPLESYLLRHIALQAGFAVHLEDLEVRSMPDISTMQVASV